MDETIEQYVIETFSPETQDQIFRSYSLFDAYGYKDPDGPLLNILANTSFQNSSDTQDMFISAFNRHLDYILKEHTLKLIDDASISEKNEILSAILLLQHLEDYESTIRLLECSEPHEEILTLLLEEYSSLDQIRIVSLIEEFDTSFLVQLKNYIYTLEADRSTDTDETFLKIQDNLKLFLKCYGTETFAAQMLQAGSMIGARFVDYLKFIANDLKDTDDNETLAMNILSLLMMTSDGYNAPLLVYRKYSEKLLSDLNRIGLIEASLIQKLNYFNDFRKQYLESEKLRKSNG